MSTTPPPPTTDDSDSNQPPSPTNQPLTKRQRQSQPPTLPPTLTLFTPPPIDETVNTTTIRTSSLTSPTLKLTGHKSSVYSLSYSADGEYLVSASFDTTCLVWAATGNCANVQVLTGHKNAVLDVKFSTGVGGGGDFVVSASADHTLGWWDAESGVRIKRFLGHTGIVNAVDVPQGGDGGGGMGSGNLSMSGSDDRTVRLWDARVRGNVGVLEHEFQVTAVAYGGGDGMVVYSAGIDNYLNAWDIRTIGGSSSGGKGGGEGQMTMKMKGHTDTITSLAINPKGTHLLSNSMDGTMKTWDIRPFVEDGGKRQCKTFEGGTHNAEKGLLNCAWSWDGSMVTGGSADKVVHIWDELTSEELYYLPGHTGCVNSVIFHPKENVIASASSDKSIFVGELSGSI